MNGTITVKLIVPVVLGASIRPVFTLSVITTYY